MGFHKVFLGFTEFYWVRRSCYGACRWREAKDMRSKWIPLMKTRHAGIEGPQRAAGPSSTNRDVRHPSLCNIPSLALSLSFIRKTIIIAMKQARKTNKDQGNAVPTEGKTKGEDKEKGKGNPGATFSGVSKWKPKGETSTRTIFHRILG